MLHVLDKRFDQKPAIRRCDAPDNPLCRAARCICLRNFLAVAVTPASLPLDVGQPLPGATVIFGDYDLQQPLLAFRLNCGTDCECLIIYVVPARALIGAEHCVEVHCDCPLAVCEARDVKGLYRRARAGEIAHFTGISSPYEAPEHADLRLDTAARGVDDCAAQVVAILRARGVLGVSSVA